MTMKKILGFILALLATGALAQPYPNKPIRVAVAFPPGGPVDIIARLLGPKLTESLGQSVVVENVVGAGGNVATTRVAKSAPDGYTILAHSSAYAVNPTLIPNAGYDGEKDFIPLAIVASQPNFIVVHADFPAKTLAELIARAKTDKLAFASAGSGTTPHLTGENLFKLRAKVDITHIPFRGGGPAAAAVLGGQPPVGVIAGSAPLPHIKAGKIRALAVSSARRLPSLPDVPTLGELGYSGMEDYTWVGFFLPAGTPPDIAQKLNDAIRRAANDPQIKERMEAQAFDVAPAPLAETAAYVKSELAKWGKVVREVGAKVD
jgi:tripartite-type tricarboxylate transporter receptor subunit TctC